MLRRGAEDRAASWATIRGARCWQRTWGRNSSLNTWPALPCPALGYAQSLDGGLAWAREKGLPFSEQEQDKPGLPSMQQAKAMKNVVMVVPRHPLDAGVSIAIGTQRSQSQKPAPTQTLHGAPAFPSPRNLT